jgi:hypothetical protein
LFLNCNVREPQKHSLQHCDRSPHRVLSRAAALGIHIPVSRRFKGGFHQLGFYTADYLIREKTRFTVANQFKEGYPAVDAAAPIALRLH